MEQVIPVQSFFDQSLMLSLLIPTGWEATSNASFKLVFVAPAEDNYRANLGFNLRKLEPPSRQAFEKLIAESYNIQKRDYNQYRLLRDQKIMLDECPAYIRFYEWHDEATNLTFSQLQAFVLAGPKALYTINGSSLAALADKYQPILEEIVHSIRFIPASGAVAKPED